MRAFSRWTWLPILLLPTLLNASEEGAMQRIMQGMGEDMAQIADGIWREEYDKVEVQAAALALKEAAGERSMEMVLNRYQALQQNCVSCHNWYRSVAEKQDQSAGDVEL